MTFLLPKLAAIILALTAGATDIRTRKVPNWLTFPGMLLGLCLQWQTTREQPLVGLIMGIMGMLLGLLSGLLLQFLPVLISKRYKNPPLGFGDTKLLGAIGACLGPRPLPLIILLFCLFFGMFALCKIASALPWDWLRAAVLSPGSNTVPTPEQALKLNLAMKSYIPAAPAIALATICGIYLAEPAARCLLPY